jgi:hypothetical protein
MSKSNSPAATGTEVHAVRRRSYSTPKLIAVGSFASITRAAMAGYAADMGMPAAGMA